MPDQTAHTSPAGTLPPPSANGSSPSAAAPRQQPRLSTRVSRMRTGLIAGVLALVVVLVFIIQNTRAVQVSFLGVDVRLSLAVALLLAAIAGALLMAAASTARITQLRRVMRRDWRRQQAEAPAEPRP
jgi:lipopolysaccharide assembly protein A